MDLFNLLVNRPLELMSLGPVFHGSRHPARAPGPSTVMMHAGLPMRSLALGTAILLGGCASPGGGITPFAVVAERPISIPAHRAHTAFQAGRQVGGVDRFEPWCELEIRSVSERPQRVEPGRFPVRRVGQAFIRDYNTRAPAWVGGLSCTDLVFQETTWWLEPKPGSPVTWLRCIAPYIHCRFGPPLSPAQMQAVVGPALRIETGAAMR